MNLYRYLYSFITISQSYEWDTMTDILEEQKGDCMEETMLKMMDKEAKDKFVCMEKKKRFHFYILIGVMVAY